MLAWPEFSENRLIIASFFSNIVVCGCLCVSICISVLPVCVAYNRTHAENQRLAQHQRHCGDVE